MPIGHCHRIMDPDAIDPALSTVTWGENMVEWDDEAAGTLRCYRTGMGGAWQR